jgi:hypothetical protein
MKNSQKNNQTSQTSAIFFLVLAYFLASCQGLLVFFPMQHFLLAVFGLSGPAALAISLIFAAITGFTNCLLYYNPNFNFEKNTFSKVIIASIGSIPLSIYFCSQLMLLPMMTLPLAWCLTSTFTILSILLWLSDPDENEANYNITATITNYTKANNKIEKMIASLIAITTTASLGYTIFAHKAQYLTLLPFMGGGTMTILLCVGLLYYLICDIQFYYKQIVLILTGEIKIKDKSNLFIGLFILNAIGNAILDCSGINTNMLPFIALIMLNGFASVCAMISGADFNAKLKLISSDANKRIENIAVSAIVFCGLTLLAVACVNPTILMIAPIVSIGSITINPISLLILLMTGGTMSHIMHSSSPKDNILNTDTNPEKQPLQKPDTAHSPQMMAQSQVMATQRPSPQKQKIKSIGNTQIVIPTRSKSIP